MSTFDFGSLASHYEEQSLVQKSAGEILMRLLEVGNEESVLDLGCGVGNLTRKLKSFTKGDVVGVDPSEGMIREARGKSKEYEITLRVQKAEELDYIESFDVIYCNSAFQWFTDPPKAIERCYNALRAGGRMGMQAPAKKVYCPNFIAAIEQVQSDPKTRDRFAHFHEPWFFLETSDEYRDLFEQGGFEVPFCRIEKEQTRYTPEEVFRVFCSGAIAGYLNQDFYDVPLEDDYIETFKQIVRDVFIQQADLESRVNLIFHRVFLIARKPSPILKAYP